MSTDAANQVGHKLANSALILAVCWGLSALIFATAYLIK